MDDDRGASVADLGYLIVRMISRLVLLMVVWLGCCLVGDFIHPRLGFLAGFFGVPVAWIFSSQVAIGVTLLRSIGSMLGIGWSFEKGPRHRDVVRVAVSSGIGVLIGAFLAAGTGALLMGVAFAISGLSLTVCLPPGDR